MRPQRQWPWYALQIAAFIAVWSAFMIYDPRGELAPGSSATLVAVGAAFLATALVSGLLRFFRFVNAYLVRHVGQTRSQDLCLSSPLRTLRDRREEATGLRVRQNARKLIEIPPKLPTVPRIAKPGQ